MNETTVTQAKQAAETHYFTPEHNILMFNEHAYIKRMTACGFDERQAEALAAEQGDLLNNLATRVDVENIDRRLDEFDQRFDEIDRRFNKVEQRLDKLEHNVEALRQEIDVAISNAKEDMAKWMVGQLILIVGFIFTLNKFTL